MILAIYRGRCCLTGLSVQEVLRASHISAWASDVKNRMNPENGLCLSATYDAAFDRHLISFDEHYCLIIAPGAKEHYTDDAFKEHFVKFEGRKIAMPDKFLPSQVLLSKHREHLVG
jgi:putative restriction endonuclease